MSLLRVFIFVIHCSLFHDVFNNINSRCKVHTVLQKLLNKIRGKTDHIFLTMHIETDYQGKSAIVFTELVSLMTQYGGKPHVNSCKNFTNK